MHSRSIAASVIAYTVLAALVGVAAWQAVAVAHLAPLDLGRNLLALVGSYTLIVTAVQRARARRTRTTATASSTATCDASFAPSLGQMIGPCVLRHGHDGPVHRDSRGACWCRRATGDGEQ